MGHVCSLTVLRKEEDWTQSLWRLWGCVEPGCPAEYWERVPKQPTGKKKERKVEPEVANPVFVDEKVADAARWTREARRRLVKALVLAQRAEGDLESPLAASQAFDTYKLATRGALAAFRDMDTIGLGIEARALIAKYRRAA